MIAKNIQQAHCQEDICTSPDIGDERAFSTTKMATSSPTTFKIT